MILRACIVCGTLSETSRCPTHHRGNSHQRGYDTKWRRTRGRYLAAHPVCQRSGCTAPAVEVHHVDGLGPLGPNGHRDSNLCGYCKPHHSQITARGQR